MEDRVLRGDPRVQSLGLLRFDSSVALCCPLLVGRGKSRVVAEMEKWESTLFSESTWPRI